LNKFSRNKFYFYLKGTFRIKKYKMKIKNSIAGLLEGKKQERKRKPFTELKSSMKKKLQKEILGLINSNPRISQLLNDHKCTLNDIGIFGGVTTKAQSQYNKICEAKDLCFISDRTMDKFKRLTDLDLPTKSFIQNHRKLIIKKIPKSTSNDFGNYIFYCTNFNELISISEKIYLLKK